MKRLFSVLLTLIAAFMGPTIPWAQQSKMYRVGLLVAGGADLPLPHLQGLRDGLEELGYIDGKNIVFDLLEEQSYAQLRASLNGYLRRRVDVLVATGGAETAIAKEATGKIPILFMPASDPVRVGFVKSLASPGENVTGLTFFTDLDEIGKQLEIFKEVVPSLRRVVVLFDGGKEYPTGAISLAAVKKVAAHVGINLTEKPIKSATEAEQALSSLPGQDGLGVFIICGPRFKKLKQVASIAIRKRLPLFGCAASQVAEQKVLLTYAPDLYYIGYRGAWYVDRVLKGAKPQDLPVETPTKFELVINLETAKKIGLKVPPEILVLADRVFN